MALNTITKELNSSNQNENEAKYLGSCLQIPKRGLQWAQQRDMSISQVANYFGASLELVRWHSNATRIKLDS